MTGHGGWPMTVFLTPDGRPFFGGTYFPQTEPPRPARLRRALPRASTTRGATGRDERRRPGRPSSPRPSAGPRCSSRPATTLPGLERRRRRRRAAASQRDDREWGGFGGARSSRRPMASSCCCARTARTGDRRRAAHGRDHASTPWPRRHLRPPRRRLRPLLGRRALAGPALREDALRQGAAGPRLPARAGRSPATPRYRQVLDETIGYVLRDLRHRRRRLLLRRGRRLRGRGGEVLRLARRRGRATVRRRRRRRRRSSGTASPKAGNFEGANILHRPARRRPAAARRGRAGPAPRCSRRATQRVRPGLDDKVLTEWNAPVRGRAGRGGAPPPATPTGSTPPRRTGEFLLRELRRADGRWLRSWQADGGARHLAYAADHAALVDAFTRLAEATGEARWIDRGRRHRRRHARAVLGRRARRAVHHRPRRRAPRHPRQGPARQRHAVGQRHRRGRAAAPRRAHRRRRATSEPGSTTSCACSPDRSRRAPHRVRPPAPGGRPARRRPAIEVVVAGDRARPGRRGARPLPAQRGARLGRARSTRRCGRAASRAWPTCASTSPAGARSSRSTSCVAQSWRTRWTAGRRHGDSRLLARLCLFRRMSRRWRRRVEPEHHLDTTRCRAATDPHVSTVRRRRPW